MKNLTRALTTGRYAPLTAVVLLLAGMWTVSAASSLQAVWVAGYTLAGHW